VELRVGCVGYSYDFWVGPFYPRHTLQSDFLHLYGKVFDLVEIDSTFYHIPAPEVAHGWRGTVPPNFLFAAKFPRVVTHEQALGGPKGPIDAFLRAIEELRPKIGPLLLQLPPAFEVRGGMERLLGFLDSLPTDQRYAVEFRHDSWMQARIFEELRRRDVAMVWNETQYLDTMPEVTTDFLYLRFIGDRSLDRLGTVQIDRTKEMERWVERPRRKRATSGVRTSCSTITLRDLARRAPTHSAGCWVCRASNSRQSTSPTPTSPFSRISRIPDHALASSERFLGDGAAPTHLRERAAFIYPDRHESSGS